MDVSKKKLVVVIFLFSVFGYIIGLFVHSEFFHHFFNWLFGGGP